MFEKYFGFRENPFKLDLDPSYLFWGKHQEEVIAHLRYALLEGEGFIAITGERGVGKTILCHSFIDNLPENAFAAYINNPVGSSEDLLRDINRQFGIEHEAETVQELTEALNTFLMQTKMEGKKVAVFIDDAHILNNDTLEQVRLISNLETSKYKLIQIVLVGESGLTEMLSSYALRQIGQRVSVKYHISNLDLDETVSYIDHRMNIAADGSPVRFDREVYKYIYKFSCGNPRAINVACNRTLTKAFYRKSARITGDTAKEVVKNLSGPGERALREYIKHRRLGRFAFGCIVLAAVAAAVYLFQRDGFEASKNDVSKHIKAEQRPFVPSSTQPQTSQKPTKLTSAGSGPKPIPSRGLENQEQSEIAVLPLGSGGEDSQIKHSPSPEMTHSVQVGAFLKMENARKLVSQLKGKGYSSDIVSVQDSKNRMWHTVRIGDYPSEETARTRADEFSSLENMETAVRPFNKL